MNPFPLAWTRQLALNRPTSPTPAPEFRLLLQPSRDRNAYKLSCRRRPKPNFLSINTEAKPVEPWFEDQGDDDDGGPETIH